MEMSVLTMIPIVFSFAFWILSFVAVLLVIAACLKYLKSS